MLSKTPRRLRITPNERRPGPPLEPGPRRWPYLLLAFGCALVLGLLALGQWQASRGDGALTGAPPAHRLAALDHLQALLEEADASVGRYLRSGERTDLAGYERSAAQLGSAVEAVRAVFADQPLDTLTPLLASLDTKRAALAAASQRAGHAAAGPDTQPMTALRGQISALRQRVVETAARERATAATHLRLSQVAGIALATVALLLTLALFTGLKRQATLRQHIAHLLASENERLDEQLRQRTGALRALARDTLAGAEAERAALARRMDQALAPLLITAQADTGWILRHLPDGVRSALQSRFERLQAGLSEAIALHRGLGERLWPLQLAEHGLLEALRSQAQALEQRGALRVELELPDKLSLDQERALTLYRIAQQALDNIRRHAQATQVRISLKSDGAMARLTITDNGIGFDPAEAFPDRHGLAAMRTRVQSFAGAFVLRTAPGEGATVSARIPLA
jgi:protein-histidine pros-kinase